MSGNPGRPTTTAALSRADTAERARQLGVDTAVVYPYVHLTEDPASPRAALRVLEETEKRLAAELEVVRAPFGWYKAFDRRCLGHPLAAQHLNRR